MPAPSLPTLLRRAPSPPASSMEGSWIGTVAMETGGPEEHAGAAKRVPSFVHLGAVTSEKEERGRPGRRSSCAGLQRCGLARLSSMYRSISRAATTKLAMSSGQLQADEDMRLLVLDVRKRMNQGGVVVPFHEDLHLTLLFLASRRSMVGRRCITGEKARKA